MQQSAPSTDTIRHSSRITLIGILALIALYVASACLGIPQRGEGLIGEYQVLLDSEIIQNSTDGGNCTDHQRDPDVEVKQGEQGRDK